MKKVFSGFLVPAFIVFAAFLLIVVWYLDCTAPRRKAQEIWLEHERVISDIAAGERVSLDDFEDAVLFFDKLTKITVPRDHSTFIDAMPTKDTATALAPLRRWYFENKDKLYWDEQTKAVRLSVD